jgi:hypothetical protein
MNNTVIYLRWPICTWKLLALDARGGVVVWSTALQAVGLRVRSRWGYFHWLNVSGRTMALGLTNPLTRVSGASPEGQGWEACHFLVPNFQKFWEAQPPEAQRGSPKLYRNFFTINYLHCLNSSVNLFSLFFSVPPGEWLDCILCHDCLYPKQLSRYWFQKKERR